MEPEALYVGSDVAKAQLDVAIHPTDDRWVIPHTEAGSRQLARADALAAAILAHFAAAVRPPVRPRRGQRTVWGGRARVRATRCRGVLVARSLQSRDPGVLPAAAGGGQAKEAGAHGLQAQAAGDPQRDVQAWCALVRPVPAGRQSFRLTFKTVAPSREGTAEHCADPLDDSPCVSALER